MQPFLLTSLRHLIQWTTLCILRRAGLSEQTVSWFDNLTDRTQCVQVEGNTSRYLKITKGVPQGSVLGPLPFILYINNIDSNVSKGKFHIQQLAKRLKLKLGFISESNPAFHSNLERGWLLLHLWLYLIMVMFYTCMLRLKVYVHLILYTMVH